MSILVIQLMCQAHFLPPSDISKGDLCIAVRWKWNETSFWVVTHVFFLLLPIHLIISWLLRFILWPLTTKPSLGATECRRFKIWIRGFQSLWKSFVLFSDILGVPFGVQITYSSSLYSVWVKKCAKSIQNPDTVMWLPTLKTCGNKL